LLDHFSSGLVQHGPIVYTTGDVPEPVDIGVGLPDEVKSSPYSLDTAPHLIGRRGQT
jgi:hypothetical protein